MELEKFFAGLKVVEFASVLAGPAVGMFFAELGAEVIKIENKTTGGDVTRQWKLRAGDRGLSPYYASVNYGKTSLLLDLTDPSDHRQALDLAAAADVVIANFRASAARRLGFDPDRLHALNPRLIYAQLQAYADADDERPAFDVVLQAETGFLSMTGEPGRAPVKMPVALIDVLAAHQLKEAVLLALLHRERTGRGSTVSASLFESAVASLANQAANYLMAGHVPGPMGTQHPNIAPYGDLYRGADDTWLLLAAGTERQFATLCRELDLPGLPADPRFHTNALRLEHRDELNRHLAAAIARHEPEALVGRLHRAGVPAARIRNLAEVFAQPAARHMTLSENRDGQTLHMVRSVAFRLLAVKEDA
jgi:crotonobetainyl-CoA:carnitine CoA-transferase CaiB-like acyl-CoA transferase